MNLFPFLVVSLLDALLIALNSYKEKQEKTI